MPCTLTETSHYQAAVSLLPAGRAWESEQAAEIHALLKAIAQIEHKSYNDLCRLVQQPTQKTTQEQSQPRLLTQADLIAMLPSDVSFTRTPYRICRVGARAGDRCYDERWVFVIRLVFADDVLQTEIDNLVARIRARLPQWIYVQIWAHRITVKYTRGSNKPAATDLCASAVLADGRIFICGGADYQLEPFRRRLNISRNAYIYDPSSDTYTPVAPYPIAMHSAQAVALQDGRVWIAGGSTATGSNIPDTYIYDPVADSYASASPSPEYLYNHAVTRLHNGKIYIITQGGAARVYDPAKDTYEQITNLPINSINRHIALTTSSGDVYIFIFGRGHFLYSPTQDAYQLLPPLSYLYFYAGVVMPDGQIFLHQGTPNYTTRATPFARLYDLTTKTEREVVGLPYLAAGYSTRILPDNRLFILPGSHASLQPYFITLESKIETN